MFYPPAPDAPRIQFLTSFATERDLGGHEGSFSRFVLGERTEAGAAIAKPYGVAGAGGKIFVVDTRGPGYAILDLRKHRIRTVAGNGDGRMRTPINIALGADGTRYVTDTARKQVLAFDSNDRFVRAYGGDFKPGDVAVLGDELLVSDIERQRIVTLDRASGAVLREFGKAGSKDGQLFQPTNIALGSDGLLYVSDTGNFRVQVFTTSGSLSRAFGGAGNGLGQFARPKGIAVDREKRVFVVDAAFENVQLFDAAGRLLLFFGGPGDEPGCLSLPAAVAVDYDDVALFRRWASPGFELEYVVLVTSQFGPAKVSAYGVGHSTKTTPVAAPEAAKRDAP